MAILDAMGLAGGGTESQFSVRFVFRIISVEPDDLTLPFKGEDVRRNAVEEPAIMADHQGAAGKIFQGFLQGAHGVDVEVVRRLVQQEDIGPLFQHPRQMNAVSLATGHDTHLFLLVGAGEVDTRTLNSYHVPKRSSILALHDLSLCLCTARPEIVFLLMWVCAEVFQVHHLRGS